MLDMKFGGYYSVADTLNMSLQVDEIGNVSHSEERTVRLGPWNVKKHVLVETDFATEKVSAVFVRVIGNLWQYIVSDYAGSIRLYVVNGSKLSLTISSLSNFMCREEQLTLRALKGGIVAWYRYDSTSQLWIRQNGKQPADNLGADGSRQGAVDVGTGSPNKL